MRNRPYAARRHRPVRVCENCRRPWPCPAEVAASGHLRLDPEAADEAVRAAIADSVRPYLDRFRANLESPQSPTTKEIGHEAQ